MHAVIDLDYPSRKGELQQESLLKPLKERSLFRLHRTRERNSSLVKRKKAQVLEEVGYLSCGVCGFSFSDFYGSVGEGLIECHHIVPLSQLRPGQRTKLSDLGLVCANCHRVLHRGGEKLSIPALRRLIRPIG